jgi:beta-glucosidase
MAIRFPEGFLWGAATSAYQIEGAHDADGKGESIWDRFSRAPGKIRNGDTGDRACEHYHRFSEDVALMQAMGLKAYRFSVSWPRVIPAGKGRINPAGIDFYSRLVDRLLAADIEPFLTLYHWDLPQALQDSGGWADRSIAGRFADYAQAVARSLGDRLRYWMTLDEPQIFGILGHLTGEKAPGVTDFSVYAAASHHINLAHGLGVQALRDECKPARIGTVMSMLPAHPLRDEARDREAARRFDGFFHRWYLDPVLRGSYPEDTLDVLPGFRALVQPNDMRDIRQELDFLGVNTYSRLFVRDNPELGPLRAELLPDHRVEGAAYTAMGWEVYPEALYEALLRLHREYALPDLYVTESGAAFDDRPQESGEVRDADRIAFLHGYISAAHRALEQGVPLRGYFVWSLLDNMEWEHGYDKRFGLIRVDFGTQERIPKQSAGWYRGVIERNGLE